MGWEGDKRGVSRDLWICASSVWPQHTNITKSQPYRWRRVYVLFHSPYDVIMQYHRVEGPALMRTRDFLSHSGEKSLRVEEACHPKYARPAIKNPDRELVISLQELREPETKRG